MAKYHYAPLVLPIVTTLPSGGAEGAMVRLHSDGKVYHRRDGDWIVDQGEQGPPGPPGLVVSYSEPEDDNILWVDPSGGPTDLPGRELAYAESTVQQVTAGGLAAIIISGLMIEFEVRERPVMVHLHLPWLMSSGTATAAGGLMDASYNVTRYAAALVGPSLPGHADVQERISTPGNYTRIGVFQRSGGAGTITNNSGLPITATTLRAVEM